MKKVKWYGILFALLVLFLYIMGTYDIFMILSHNAAYYDSKGYGENAIIYFTNYPGYLLVFWILNLVCGLISPIIYLLKRRIAFIIAFISAVADLILIILGVVFRNRISSLGVNIFGFDLFILITTFLFAIFLFKQRTKSEIQ